MFGVLFLWLSGLLWAMTSAVEEVVVPSLGGGGCGCGGGGRKRKCDCNHFPVPVPDAESDSEDEILEDGIVSSDEEDEKVDPFVDSYGRHVITNNEYRHYSRQVRESGVCMYAFFEF